MITNRIIRSAALLATAGTLSACGGSSGNQIVETALQAVLTSATYETIDSVNAEDSTLGGTGLRTNGTTGAVDITSYSGTIRHSTDVLTITDGTDSLTDGDGRGSGGTYVDGDSRLRPDLAPFTGSYAYVTPANHTYVNGGTSFDASVFYGVVTRPGDMPSTGIAAYSGEAIAALVTPGSAFSFTGGDSNVAVNFGSGSVEVLLNGFSVTDPTTGAAASAPIDTITLTGMAISGNTFSGGSITTTSGLLPVDVTGSGTVHSAQGNFYGFDDIFGAPDEVAGITHTAGADGTLVTSFIAD